MLLKAATSAFQDSVNQSIESQKPYLQLDRPQFNPEAIPARQRLLMHYRKLLVNLLRWRKFSGAFFGIDEIITRLVTSAMLPLAESGWDVGGGDSMREVCAVF